jgi:hypothetical protein
MDHGPTELDDTLRAFKELSMSVSIVDLTEYISSGRNMKSAYISSFIGMFSN